MCNKPNHTHNELRELVRLYKEDKSKSGEIRQLSDAELQNLPSHMIRLSAEEEELLNQFEQSKRVELYWKFKAVTRNLLLKKLTFTEFLRSELEMQ